MVFDKKSPDSEKEMVTFERNARRCVLNGTLPTFLKEPLVRKPNGAVLLVKLQKFDTFELTCRIAWVLCIALFFMGLYFASQLRKDSTPIELVIPCALFALGILNIFLFKRAKEIVVASSRESLLEWNIYLRSLHSFLDILYPYDSGFNPDIFFLQFEREDYSEEYLYRRMASSVTQVLEDIQKEEGGQIMYMWALRHAAEFGFISKNVPKNVDDPHLL